MTTRDAFIAELAAALRQRLAKHPEVEVCEHAAPEPPGQTNATAPAADLLLYDRQRNVTFLVQLVAGADVGQSMVRFRAYLEACPAADTAIIEVCAPGTAPTKAAKQFVEQATEDLCSVTPHFWHGWVAPRRATPEQLVNKIVAKMNAAIPDLEDERAAVAARREYLEEGGVDFRDYLAEVERDRALPR